MKREKKKKHFVDRSLVISVIITLIYFGVIRMHKGVYYRLNDDLTIRRILSGEYSGRPSQYVYGVNIFLCTVLKCMYSIIPQIDFWGCLLLFCHVYLLALFIFLVCKLECKKSDQILSIVFVVTLYSCMYMHEIFFISFTSAGVVCGIIGVLHLILAKQFFYNRKIEIVNKLLSVCFCFLSFCVRKDTFLMMIPYVFLVLCIEYRENAIDIIKYIICMILGIVILAGTHQIIYSASEWESYITFRDGRKVVHDYIGFPDYDANEEFYEKLGIQQYEYECFKSGVVNTVLDYSVPMETIYDSIIENFSPKMTSKLFFNRLVGYSVSLWGTQERRIWLMMVGIAFVQLVIRLIKNKNKAFLYAFGCVNLLVILEYLYLVYNGRYTNTVMESMIAMWLFMLVVLLILKDREETVHTKISYLFTCSLVYFIVIMPVLNGRIETYKNADNSTNLVNEYCKANSNNSYFGPAAFMSGTTDKIGFIFDNSFENRIVMGGWNAFSLTYEDKLETCGLSLDVEEEILHNDNVYIISDDVHFTPIDEYFNAKYDGYTYEIIDTISTTSFGEVNVYNLEIQ